MLVFNDWVGFNVILDGFYEVDELQTLKKYLNNNLQKTSFLDIGANIGNHSIFMSDFFKFVKSFEPQRRVFKVLQFNTERFDNIEIFNYGIDELKRTTIFNIPFNNTGSGSEYFSFENSYNEEVLLKPLENKFFKNTGLIKIDVEGNEYGVLKTLNSLFKISSPLIILELHNNHPKKTEILNFLKSNNYDEVFLIETPKNRIHRVFNLIFRSSKKLIKLKINQILKSKKDFNFLIFQKSNDNKIEYKKNNSSLDKE